MASRQTFGTEWWTRQWLSALEAFGWESRLERGRSYARTGRVGMLLVEAGVVEARVRGSRATPYAVVIRLQAFPRSVWDSALDIIATRARYAGQLLAGEMPSDIDELFAASGHSLFPQTRSELSASCSCPDEANPCKHIAAVHYVLGARFDADPFVLLWLRGMRRDTLLSEIRARRHVPEPTVVGMVQPDAGMPSRPVALAGFHGDVNDVPLPAPDVEPCAVDGAAFALSLPRALASDGRLVEGLVQAAQRAVLAAAEMD